jgi:inner membrane protein YidH
MAETPAGGELSISDQLSVERTRLSHDRTLMSNVRTSTTLISFGFTIYKFFADLQERGEIAHPDRLLGSRHVGFLMVAIGVVYVIVASLSYQQQMSRMKERYGISLDRLPLALAVVISFLGGVGLLAIILRQ